MINELIIGLIIPYYYCFVGAGLNRSAVESLGLSKYSIVAICTSADSSTAHCDEYLISVCLLSRDCALPGTRLSESLLETTVDVDTSFSDAEPDELNVSQCRTRASQKTASR
jgi:hypothetical protein